VHASKSLPAKFILKRKLRRLKTCRLAKDLIRSVFGCSNSSKNSPRFTIPEPEHGGSTSAYSTFIKLK